MIEEKIATVKIGDEDIEKKPKDKVEIPQFPMPKPDPRCKKCYGTGRLGYEYDPKNIEFDENDDRKKGKSIPCPNYAKIIQKETKKFFDSLTPEQQYELMKKEGDPKTLAEAKLIQDAHDKKVDEENEKKSKSEASGIKQETKNTDATTESKKGAAAGPEEILSETDGEK